VAKAQLIVEGRSIESDSGRTVLQACLDAGVSMKRGVGCMGQAVCGACRVLVRLRDSREVTMRLACETLVVDGMNVAYVGDVAAESRHVHDYNLESVTDGWSVLSLLERSFPEAAACRHCGGCDRACPKQLHIEDAVAAANAGRLQEAADAFETCVMCGLCTAVCPEQIAPNHLGLFVRRSLARLSLLPADLLSRLREIESGAMRIDLSACAAPVDAESGQGARE
jgi:ferredoxin